eukprot:2545414-Pyramimonas_sp.AAC.1
MAAASLAARRSPRWVPAAVALCTLLHGFVAPVIALPPGLGARGALTPGRVAWPLPHACLPGA